MVNMEPGASEIWYRNPRAAFDRSTAHKFIPLRTMSLTDQLNAVFRLGLYYSLLMVLLTRKSNYLTVALLAGAITAAVHELSSTEQFAPADVSFKKRCVSPTKSNPYMNVTLDDLEKRPDRGPACDPLSPGVRQEISASEKIPLTDNPHAFGRSQHPFYTMPSTTIPNAQGEFAKLLYGGRQSNALGARA
jgi:hypothetical protein